jgi:hypothetical protein
LALSTLGSSTASQPERAAIFMSATPSRVEGWLTRITRSAR